jgi:metal-sulfur cluster biosynthetic enzyme
MITGNADGRLEEVWACLATVTDPELDESVTDLGFVDDVSVEGDAVAIDFRLPTYWCAANFAYLMADDMRRAVAALPWVAHVRPHLHDHMCADQVNAGAAAGLSFGAAFGDMAEDESLEALRATFTRKAFQRRQETVLRALLRQGSDKAELVTMPLAKFDAITLDDPEAAAQKPRYRAIRDQLGGPAGPTDRAFVTPDGAPLTEDGFDTHLQALRSVRINMEFNGTLCRGLLAVRDRAAVPSDPDAKEPALVDFITGRVPA